MGDKRDFVIRIGEYKIPVLVDDKLKNGEIKFVQPQELSDEQRRRICVAFGVPAYLLKR